MMASLDDFVLQLNDRLSDAKKENSLPCCLIDRPVDQVSNGRADDFFTEAQKQQPNDPTDFNNLDRPANNKDALNHDARLFTQDDCMHTSTSLNLQSTSTLERTDGNVAVDNTIGGNSCNLDSQTEYSVTLQVPVHVFEIRIEVHLEGYDVLHTNLYCQLISHKEVKMSFQQDGQEDRINQSLQQDGQEDRINQSLQQDGQKDWINQSLQHFDHPGCHSLISLSLKHLPADVQVDSLLLFVKLFSLLIVKINHRRRLRTQTAAVCGTGLIFERPAEIRIQEDTGRCEGHIFIATSENIIPNEAEARACEVTFSSRAMNYFKVGKLAVDSVEHVSKSGETKTYLKCRTSDMAFVSVLNTIQEKVKMLANDLPLSVKQRLTKMALVISYPHGDEMTMSYGDCAVIKRKLSDETVDGNRHLWLQNLTASGSESPHETVQVLLHTAPTCIGSLGAPIITFKQNIASSVEQDQYSLNIWTHDGVLEPSEFGCSSIKACTEDELRLYSGVMVACTSNQPHLSSMLNTQHNGTSRMLSTRQQTQLAEVQNAQVSALQTEVQPQQAQVPALETEVQSQQTHLPALETEVESQQTHLPALEPEVQYQQTQLPALETEVQYQQTQLPALETEVEIQQTQLPALETEVESQQTQLPALETEVQYQQTQLPALETEVESPQTQLPALEPEVQYQQTQLPALETEVESQQTQLPALETEVQYQQTQLTALETEVESPQTQLPALEPEVQYQQTQLPALETEVESQQTQLPALETEVESPQTQLPALETEVESQQTQLPVLETEVESQQTQLPALETEVESQQTEAYQLDLQQTQETLQEVRQSGPHHHDLLRPNFNNRTDRKDAGPNLAIQPPSYPAYIRFEKRLESFVGWLSGNILSPATLARNGFFYAGYSDCVRCYYCGIGLKSWKLGDDVVTEHQRFRPNCHFLIKLLASDFNVRPGGFQMPSQETLDSHESQESAGSIDQKSEAGEINSKSTDQTSSSLKTERTAMSEGGPQAVQDITVRLLQEEKKRLEALMQCKVCSKNPIKSLFLPCGDLYACQECSGNLSHCPQCNKKILATVTTYFS